MSIPFKICSLEKVKLFVSQQHTRESHVTVRDSFSSEMEMDSSQDSILQRIRRGILDEEIMEESHFETPMQGIVYLL